MSIFLKAVAGVLLTVVLILSLGREGQPFSLLLGIFCCATVLMLALSFLEPVLDLLYRLEALGNLDSTMVSILFKVLGIALLSEVCAMICSDAGNASMGKGLQLLAGAVILWISIPVLDALLTLIQTILGEI